VLHIRAILGFTFPFARSAVYRTFSKDLETGGMNSQVDCVDDDGTKSIQCVLVMWLKEACIQVASLLLLSAFLQSWLYVLQFSRLSIGICEPRSCHPNLRIFFFSLFAHFYG